MKLVCILIVFVLAFLIGQVVIFRIYLFSFRRRLFDPVSSRKVHTGLIPRLGGMMFLPVQCGIFMLMVVFFRHYEIVPISYALLYCFLLLMCGLGLLFIVGMIDDLIGVRHYWKLLAQLAAALCLPLSGLWIDHLGGLFGIGDLPPGLGIPLTVFIVVYLINAFNLIDGIDGLCSGLAMLACTVLGILHFIHESWLAVLFSFITVGVLAPFFYYNVWGKSQRRRRIFMGDTGSMTLGLTVAFLVVSYVTGFPEIAVPKGNLLVAFSVVMVPTLDVLRVMLVRLLARKPLFQPDKSHIHHYLLDLGLTKHTTLTCLLLIALGYVIFNMYMVKYVHNDTLTLLLVLIFWFVGLGLYGKIKVKRNKVK